MPYSIHTILPDNGIQFTNRLKDRWAFKHLFDRICAEYGIEHRLTKVNHPWTNGQVERMNRTIKAAAVKRYHYETHEQLKEHLAQFLAAYNFAKRLKTLRGLTPYEHINKCWQKEPERFRLGSHHLTLGLNTRRCFQNRAAKPLGDTSPTGVVDQDHPHYGHAADDVE